MKAPKLLYDLDGVFEEVFEGDDHDHGHDYDAHESSFSYDRPASFEIAQEPNVFESSFSYYSYDLNSVFEEEPHFESSFSYDRPTSFQILTPAPTPLSDDDSPELGAFAPILKVAHS